MNPYLGKHTQLVLIFAALVVAEGCGGGGGGGNSEPPVKRAPGLVGAADVNHWPGRDHQADARRRARAGFTLDAIEWAPWRGIADPACPGEPSSSTTFPAEAKARVDAMRAEGLTVLINVVNANGCAQWRQPDSYVHEAVDFIATKIGAAGVILSGVSEPGVRGHDPKSLRWTEVALSLWDGLVATPGSTGHPYWPALERDFLDDHVCSDASAIAALERGDRGVIVNTDCTPILDPGPERAAKLTRASVAGRANLLVYCFDGCADATIDAMAAAIAAAPDQTVPSAR